MIHSPELRVPLGLALAWAGATLPACAEPAPGEPAVIIESLTAGGREQSIALSAAPPPASGGRPPREARFRSYEPVRLPVGAQTVDFRLVPKPATTDAAVRIQFQLAGWDEDWREAEGTMWLSIRFLDEQGRRISSAALPRAGQSGGWTGDPRTSRFRIGIETIVPPARTRQIQIFLTAGGSRTMGIWLVRGLRVIARPGENQPERVLLDERIARGDDLHDPRGVPVGWRREGTNSSIPQVFTFGAGDGAHALALIDPDVRSTGRWIAAGRNIVAVEPGVPLRIEIEEAFSIGASGTYTCSYHKLPAGRYTFRAIPVDEFGVPAGIGVELPIALAPPFHATPWFWSIVATTAVASVAGGVRYATRRRLQRQLEVSERRRAVEAERMRIAQDLHDDMGARLTQISLASRLALQHTPPDAPAHGDLRRLDRAAREVAIALDEIVWAVNPAHDTLAGLGDYLSQYVTEVTAESTMRCRLDIPALLPARFVSSGVRHHLLMALKEVINNALKHSGATELRVQLVFQDPTLTLTLADNGRGFDPERTSAGNGIANMKRRLEAAGGSCEVSSSAGHGTTVTFRVRLESSPAIT